MPKPLAGGLRVMFCCNSHRNGMPVGRVSHVSIDDVIQLDGPLEEFEDDDGEIDFEGDTPYDHRDGRVIVGGKSYPHRGYTTWHGSWCWDSAILHPKTAARLLNDLRRAGWDCVEAECGLFRKWEAGEEITAEDLEG